jgi:hypothetical protein
MQFVVAKNFNGFLSPDEFNLVINQAQLSFVDYLLGEFQTYQNGRPVARVELGNNEIVRQRLTPFIGENLSLTVDSNGFAAYPTDYQQVDAMYTTSMDRIRYVQQHKLYSYLGSVIDPIATNPIYLIKADGFRFYPSNIGTVKLSYVKTPPDIVWAYTLVNNRPVYDPANSVDPKFYDVDTLEIIARALKLVGVNLQSAEVSLYANQITQNGQ